MKMPDRASRAIAARNGSLKVALTLAACALLLDAMPASAQQLYSGSASPEVAASDAFLGIGPGAQAAVSTFAATAPDMPIVISPLSIEPDANGVNLATGKILIPQPGLGVPGAPNLRMVRLSDLSPYIAGRQSGTAGEVVLGSYSVHTMAGT